MQLNTYESAARPDVFVTMPTVEAGSIMMVVDRLIDLRLNLVRKGYTLCVDSHHLPFLKFVTWEIGAQGYAIHGSNPAFE